MQTKSIQCLFHNFNAGSVSFSCLSHNFHPAWLRGVPVPVMLFPTAHVVQQVHVDYLGWKFFYIVMSLKTPSINCKLFESRNLLAQHSSVWLNFENIVILSEHKLMNLIFGFSLQPLLSHALVYLNLTQRSTQSTKSLKNLLMKRSWPLPVILFAL
jgi:hypothetical protein